MEFEFVKVSVLEERIEQRFLQGRGDGVGEGRRRGDSFAAGSRKFFLH